MTSPRFNPDKAFYIDAVKTNSALLASAARLGLGEPVPSCPGWFVATLVAHIGEVQRFWALQINERAREQVPLPRSAFESCPGLYEWFDSVDSGATDLSSIPPTLIEWFEAASTELVDAFERITPDETVWHWSGDHRARAHFRNQAIEAAVHRWDAQNAHHAVTPIERRLAEDGIDQHFEVQVPFARSLGASRKGNGETYMLTQSDGERSWLVQFADADLRLLEAHDGTPDVTVSGSAEEFFLWLWGRIPPDRLASTGDRALLTGYGEWWAYPKDYR
jgi:uncharacterized protein (TIGR03083 family)